MKWAYNSFPCRVAICLDCGLVKLNPRWSESRYADFYKSKYDLFFRGPGVPISELFISDIEGKGKAMSERLADVALPQKLRVLDIGAGTGFSFFAVLNSRDESHADVRTEGEFYAVEASERCREFLRSKNIKIVATDLSEQLGQEYDFVVCRHVLEHAVSPLSVLAKVREALTENGYAYVAVPNMMQYAKSKADTFFRHVHTFYFNITTLVGCCENVGLYPVKAGWEGENWVILSTRKTECPVPQISYRQQRDVLEEVISCQRCKVKSFVGGIARRVRYGCI